VAGAGANALSLKKTLERPVLLLEEFQSCARGHHHCDHCDQQHQHTFDLLLGKELVCADSVLSKEHVVDRVGRWAVTGYFLCYAHGGTGGLDVMEQEV